VARRNAPRFRGQRLASRLVRGFVERNPLLLLVVAGIGIRIALAFAFFGSGDLSVMEFFGRGFEQDALDVYGINEGRNFLIWPYPPAYFAWVVVALELADFSGLPYHGIVQLLPIAADVGVAVAVHVYLGWRGAGERLRLAGAALVMLGPCFIAISGYHGQIDSVAILPAVLALMVWERTRARGRALEAGLLIGLGAAIKTVPLLVVAPLLGSVRSLRESAVLIGAAAGVPLLMLLPFFIAEPDGVRAAAEYQGLQARGGLGLVVDPALAVDRLGSLERFGEGTPNGLNTWLDTNAVVIIALVLVGYTLFVVRYRPSPIDAVVMLWLTVYVFSPNFLLQYLIWGLPFFIMAGYLREVAVLQLALVPALVITYLIPFENPTPAAIVYLPSMILLWGFWAVALVTLAARVVRRRDTDTRGTQPPLVTVTADSRA
jgi:hypothetical protein